jgi:hypothetical protein
MTDERNPTTAGPYGDKTGASIDTITWPAHKGAMHVTHNEHKSYYESVEKAIGDRDEGPCTYDRGDFPDEEEIRKAIDTGEVWEIQWYPDTPVGFYTVCAATLSRALEVALNV